MDGCAQCSLYMESWSIFGGVEFVNFIDKGCSVVGMGDYMVKGLQRLWVISESGSGSEHRKPERLNLHVFQFCRFFFFSSCAVPRPMNCWPDSRQDCARSHASVLHLASKQDPDSL